MVRNDINRWLSENYVGCTIGSGGRDAAVRNKGNISCENIPEVK